MINNLLLFLLKQNNKEKTMWSSKIQNKNNFQAKDTLVPKDA